MHSITLPPGVIATATGLVVPADLPIAVWVSIGERLAKVECATVWQIADWWAHGSHVYGRRKAIVAATTPLGARFSFGTLMNLGSTARAVAASRRREVLSFSHHVEVAKLSPERQDYWLSRAVAESLSVAKLRSKMLEAARGEHAGFSDEEKARAWLQSVQKIAQTIERMTVFSPSLPREVCDLLRRDPDERAGFIAACNTFANFGVSGRRQVELDVRAARLAIPAAQEDDDGVLDDVGALAVVAGEVHEMRAAE